ncbi:hypothetical protein ACFV4Q_22525 [Streptomyces nojiriensis]|uniref:hypothetical protein n=1 Tax=Streptomyces nojiriensis TaxID=66374 RepID=UPI0036640A6C
MPQLTRPAAACLTLLVLTGCGTSTVAGSAPETEITTKAPIPTQDRDVACGAAIDPPISHSQDPLRLAITAVQSRNGGFDVSWSITSAHVEQLLSVPVEPTAPTAFLLREGKVAGRKTPAPPEPQANAGAHPVGRTPYTGVAKVDQLCPGTAWADIAAHPDQYSITVIASDPSKAPTAREVEANRPCYLPDTVFQEFHSIPAVGS